MIFDDRFSGTSLDTTKSTNSLGVRATVGLIARARLAFALRWSACRRRHQAAARWHHHSTRLTAAAT